MLGFVGFREVGLGLSIYLEGQGDLVNILVPHT